MNKTHLKRSLKHAKASLHDAKNCLKMSCAERKKEYWGSQVKKFEVEVAELTTQLEVLEPKPVDTTVNAHKVLLAAAGHLSDRAITYDNPTGERSMADTVALFNLFTGHKITESEGWRFMVFLKLVRSKQGKFKADNHEDAVAYEALAAEALQKEKSSGQS